MSGCPFEVAGQRKREWILEITMSGCTIQVLGLRNSCGLPEILRDAAEKVESQHKTLGFTLIREEENNPYRR